MSKLLCNVLKIPRGANAPKASPWLRAWGDSIYFCPKKLQHLLLPSFTRNWCCFSLCLNLVQQRQVL